MTAFRPYHLLLDWDAGQMVTGRLLGELTVEIVAGVPQVLSNYNVPITFDPNDPIDGKGLTWLKQKCKTAVQAQVAVDPTNGGI